MTRISFFRKWSAMVLFTAVLLAGCRSSAPPVQFYTLSSVSTATEKANPTDAAPNISVGVGPVEIPKVLDRPQIVTRTGPNKITLNEFHRWAGPLQEDFARVLAENISLLLGIDQVAVYPWEAGFAPDYRIALDIRSFEGQWGKDVRLDVIWRVADQAGQKILAVKKSIITEPLPTADYETLVAAQSRAIARLSREIVREIRDLQSGKN
ncbi:MAG: PqiC family protein [Desulfobacterales bacterium]|jgi:uncharacterized lipoprotein YmbA